MPVTPTAQFCPIHGVPKRLRTRNSGRRVVAECRVCHAERCRRDRAALKAARIRSQIGSVLRCDAERAIPLVRHLVRLCGGWERLPEHLTNGQIASIAVRLAGTVDELYRRSDEADSRALASAADATRNPAIVAAAAQLLRAAGWKIEAP